MTITIYGHNLFRDLLQLERLAVAPVTGAGGEHEDACVGVAADGERLAAVAALSVQHLDVGVPPV